MNEKRFDWFSLLAGLATLFVSGYVLADGPDWIEAVDFRWLVAGSLGLVGAVLLGSSLRRSRD